MQRAISGQKVICLDNKYVKHALTTGDDYLVEASYQNYPVLSGKPHILKDAYAVICDDGVERVYAADRFEFKQ